MNVASQAIRVMVVDDHPVVRDGVSMLLRPDSRIQVVAGALTVRDAIAQLPQVRPDVLLLDLRLPDMLAPEAIRRLRAVCPGVKIVIFTAYPDHGAMDATLAAGIDGYLLKDAGTMDLVRALRQVVAGVRVVDPRLGGHTGLRLRERLDKIGLTRREYDVLRLAAMGNTNPEIAEELDLARNTVKTYLQSAMQKLGARNRVEAIAKAQEAHLL
jgi:two-component system nitrate/nitrite response regulator NarL